MKAENGYTLGALLSFFAIHLLQDMGRVRARVSCRMDAVDGWEMLRCEVRRRRIIHYIAAMQARIVVVQ